jgi:hypothetical protein
LGLGKSRETQSTLVKSTDSENRLNPQAVFVCDLSLPERLADCFAPFAMTTSERSPMPQQSTDATEAVNRSFELDGDLPVPNDSVDCAEWIDDCLNDWYNN